MAFASLLILMGLGGGQTWALVWGIVLEVLVFGASAWLAFQTWRGRPRPSWLPPLLTCLALVYVATGVAALFAGGEYLPIVLLAALIPTSALLLLAATAGTATRAAEVDERDPAPKLPPDRETPVGDTPEHSEAAEGTPISRPRR